jgi:hypothetical protein
MSAMPRREGVSRPNRHSLLSPIPPHPILSLSLSLRLRLFRTLNLSYSTSLKLSTPYPSPLPLNFPQPPPIMSLKPPSRPTGRLPLALTFATV